MFKRKKKETFPTLEEIRAQVEAMPLDELIAKVHREYDALGPERQAFARHLVEEKRKQSD